jgi:hypothetical protein
LSEASLIPVCCAAQEICAEVNAPHAGRPDVGVGVGLAVGFDDGFGAGAFGRAGGDDGDGDRDGGVNEGGDEPGPAGVVASGDCGGGAWLSTTMTCGPPDGAGCPVGDGVAIGDSDGAAVPGTLEAEVELFGTTMSGVVPGVVVTMKPSPAGPDAAWCGVGESAFEPITPTLAVAAEVTPASSAAVTTVLVEVAASAEGSLASAQSFMPATSPWAVRASG